MKQFVLFIMISISLSLDCIILPKLLFWGIRPSVTMCMVLCIGILNGRFSGAMAGLCAGVLMDFLFGPKIGYYALLMMLTGYIVTNIYINRFSESIIILAIYTACAFVGKEIIFAFAARLRGARTENVLLLFLRYIVPSAVVTGLCMIPVYTLVRRVFRAGFMKRKWKISTE